MTRITVQNRDGQALAQYAYPIDPLPDVTPEGPYGASIGWPVSQTGLPRFLHSPDCGGNALLQHRQQVDSEPRVSGLPAEVERRRMHDRDQFR
jgi:hypothetical protein